MSLLHIDMTQAVRILARTANFEEIGPENDLISFQST